MLRKIYIFHDLSIVSCRNKLKTRAAMKISCLIQSEKFVVFYIYFVFYFLVGIKYTHNVGEVEQEKIHIQE